MRKNKVDQMQGRAASLRYHDQLTPTQPEEVYKGDDIHGR
jgi:hypothetical protein